MVILCAGASSYAKKFNSNNLGLFIVQGCFKISKFFHAFRNVYNHMYYLIIKRKFTSFRCRLAILLYMENNLQQIIIVLEKFNIQHSSSSTKYTRAHYLENLYQHKHTNE